MPLDCSISSGYQTNVEQKLKLKNTARYRFDPSKLRDLLREKCRIRVKEARHQIFAHNRAKDESLKQLSLESILRQELAELEHDISLQDEIYNELKKEVNDWVSDQFEEEQNYLIDGANSQTLVCPICQISNMVIFQADNSSFNYRCQCSANFTFSSHMEILRVRLTQCIDEHEQRCLSKLDFFVNPLTNLLECICGNCDFFCTL